MRVLALLAVSFQSFANAAVTFPNSQIFQAPDIAVTNKLNFKCKTTCKVYVDRKSDKLMITQDGNVVAPFNTIVSGNAFAPTGVVLPPADNYYLENRGEPNPEFVMYVVETNALNFGASVYAPQATIGVSAQDKTRYITVLSSFEAIWFSGFNGNFPEGYPRIYTAPYDAPLEKCHPVYQARSQYNAEVSWPTIASAVFTVDFGYVGTHNVSINTGKIEQMSKNGGTTNVYTSPGYVGCSFNVGQNYHSSLSQVKDHFSFVSDGLNVNGAYTALTNDEPVTFIVNNQLTNLVGSGIYTMHEPLKKTFDVSISWVRKTPTSDFALQLDFLNNNEPAHYTAPVPQTTTSTGRFTSPLVALALVITFLIL